MLFSKANAQQPLPNAQFMMDTNQICQGGSVNFTNLSTGNIVSQIWTFNGSQTFQWFEPGNPPAIVYQNWANGGFMVSLMVTDNYGNTSYFEDHVTVWPSPTMETVFPNQATICDGDSVIFTPQSNAENPSYHWRRYDSGFDTIVTTSSISLSEQGGYEVRAINERGCESQGWGIFVNVHNPISLTWSGDFPNQYLNDDTVEVCERPYMTWLYANANNIYAYSPSTFTWQNGQNGSSVQVDSTQLYVLTVYDGANVCGATIDSMYVLVHPKPTPPISITPSGTEFCEGDMITLSTDTMYSNVSWTYTNLSTQYTAQTETFNPEASGTYRVFVTDEFGCGGDAETPFIAINPRPTKPEVIVANGCLLAGSSAPTGTNYVYQWFLQSDSVVGATDQFFTTETAGFYTVQVTYMENGCSNLSDPTYASCDLSGIIEMVDGTTLAYPNPFTESFTFPTDHFVSATLINMYGAVVATKSGSTDISFDGSSIAAGVYQLMIEDGDEKMSMRLVKN